MARLKLIEEVAAFNEKGEQRDSRVGFAQIEWVNAKQQVFDESTFKFKDNHAQQAVTHSHEGDHEVHSVYSDDFIHKLDDYARSIE